MPNTPRLGLPYPAATAPADVPADLQALATALDSLVYIVGELRTFAMLAAPAKWLASGALVNQADYPELYASVGGLWNLGGEAAGTFRAGPPPGRALVVAGASAGLTNRAVGARWGSEGVTLTAPQSGNNGNGRVAGVGGHQHQSSTDNPTKLLSNGNGGVQQYNLAGGFDSILAFINTAVTGSAGGHDHPVNAKDADAAHDNNQPSVGVLVAIYAGR
jgi:hypothetical protein